jgi:hypothetical protein
MTQDVYRFISPKSQENADIHSFCARSVNDAVRELNLRHWDWALTKATTTIVVGTGAYAVATDFYAPRHITLDATYSNRVPFMPIKEFLDTFTNLAGSGVPTAYTVQPTSTGLNYLFDQVFQSGSGYTTFTAYYYMRIQLYANPTDTIDAHVPSEVEEWILWRAREIAAATYAPTDAVVARANQKDIWKALVARENFNTDWS